MVASFLNCFLKGINKKSYWPTSNFSKLETDPSFYYSGNRGKGLLRIIIMKLTLSYDYTLIKLRIWYGYPLVI